MALGRLPVSPQLPRSANSRNSKLAMLGLSEPAKPGSPAAQAQVGSGNYGGETSVRIDADLPGTTRPRSVPPSCSYNKSGIVPVMLLSEHKGTSLSVHAIQGQIRPAAFQAGPERVCGIPGT